MFCCRDEPTQQSLFYQTLVHFIIQPIPCEKINARKEKGQKVRECVWENTHTHREK